MANNVEHSAAMRLLLAQAVLDRIDLDVGAGQLVITTSVPADLVPINLVDPAAPAATDEVLTFDCTPQLEGTATGAGDAALFRITDNSGNTVLTGTVGTSGADINLSSLTIAISDTVAITSLTYTASV